MGEILKLIETANNYIGAKEGDKKYNELIAAFESNKKYKYDGQGCCEIACAFFVLAFGLRRAKQLIPIVNYANAQAELWKKGLSKTPKVGALVYFGNIRGEVNHVELVTGIYGDELETIDGNASHKVIKRRFEKNSRNIIGYGVPSFTEDKEYLFKTWIECAFNDITVKRYSKGELVRWVQEYLTEKGFYKGYTDGIAGEYTQNAIIEWQRANNLVPDGVIGRYCWTFILK